MEDSPEKQWMEQEKLKVARKLLFDHPGHVLIELQKSKTCTLNCFEKKSLLVPNNFPFYRVLEEVRDRIENLDKSQSLFCYVGRGSLVKTNSSVGDLYEKYRDPEGFLQVRFSDVPAFG